MNIKQIGKIQIIISCILFVIVVVGGIFATFFWFEKTLTRASLNEVEETNILDAKNVTVSEQLLITSLTAQVSIVTTSMFVFWTCDFIIFILAILFLLEGLTKLEK